MQMYRLTQKKYANSPFSPVGAKLFGGRWNSRGTEALYFAESESLCSLEVFVHLSNDHSLIQLYDLYRIDIPVELIVKLDASDLPAIWRAIPCGQATQNIGDSFLNEPYPEYAALQVPSIVSPRDNNYVVNPNQPSMSNIFKKAEKLDIEFEPRIFN